MAIKAADLIHVGNGTFMLDRLQSGGPGQLSQNVQVDKELGNYKSVATTRDTPDLSFSLESWDVTTEIEQMLTRTASVGAGGMDMSTVYSADMLAHVKPGALAGTPFAVVESVAMPLLFPERLSYSFATEQNSSLTVGLRGDQINWNPGPSYNQRVAGSGSPAQTIVLTNPAGVYADSTGDTRILALSIDGQRQIEGLDFSVVATTPADDFTACTITMLKTVAATSIISVVYFSSTALSFLQNTHPLSSVKPSAVKGRDIRVYVGATYDPADVPASDAYRWSGLQAATVDWAQTIVKDTELGLSNAVTIEPEDAPTVNGQLTLRARTPQELHSRLQQITGVANPLRSIGPNSAVEQALDIVIRDSAGVVTKRLHVPDARFTVPGYQAQVGQRLDAPLQMTSDSGTLVVYAA